MLSDIETFVFLNISHYEFFPVENPLLAREKLLEALRGCEVRGTVLIAPEGVNLNLAGPKNDAWVENFCAWWVSQGGTQNPPLKKSVSSMIPFKKLKVRVKKEIVTLGMPELDVRQWTGPHMPAHEFSKVLENPKDWVILDTRNDFEYEIGTYKGAQPVGMKSFRDFVKISEDLKEKLPEDQNIVMFCTGGIRCEKATALMRARGFKNVHQVDGGILRHLELENGKHWEGSCFVFDDRAGVDSQLEELKLV